MMRISLIISIILLPLLSFGQNKHLKTYYDSKLKELNYEVILITNKGKSISSEISVDTDTLKLNIDSLITNYKIDSLVIKKYKKNTFLDYTIEKSKGPIYSKKYPFNFNKIIAFYDSNKITKKEYHMISDIFKEPKIHITVNYNNEIKSSEVLYYNGIIIHKTIFYETGEINEYFLYNKKNQQILYEKYDQSGEILMFKFTPEIGEEIEMEKKDKKIKVKTSSGESIYPN